MQNEGEKVGWQKDLNYRSSYSNEELYDVTGTERQVIWHYDPSYEALIRKLLADLKPERFVETGTYKAGTTRWMAERFPDLPYYSVEVNHVFYAEALEWVKRGGYKNVHLFHMSSPDFLKNYTDVWKGLTFFYLDAHIGNSVEPLKEECRIISGLDRYICVIDDFSMNLAEPPGGINLSCVKDAMGDNPYLPAYPVIPPFVGYAMYLKGVEFELPSFVKRAKS